jgi:hypothetical protein
LPYTEFLRCQVAGDLLPAPKLGDINKDGLDATGFLAIADFVPGDVDKEQMIADYVNDQIDVVGRAFLGLSIACARCHDHKFDPISTEDYYALAGIFFSTRLIPGPVPGNTPLIRVPLLSRAEIAEAKEQNANDRRRRAELEQQLPDALDRAYLEHVQRLVREQTAQYLRAACDYRNQAAGPARPALIDFAKQHQLPVSLLSSWIGYLDRLAKQPLSALDSRLPRAATGSLTGAALTQYASELQHALAAHSSLAAAKAAEAPQTHALAHDRLLAFRADDPNLVTNSEGSVTLWPNRADLPGDARPANAGKGPVIASTMINGRNKNVARFDGRALLEVPRRVPPTGSLFVVFQRAAAAPPGQRLVGWEDADVGQHGLGLMLDANGRLQAILRDHGQAGDLVDTRGTPGFERVCITWGAQGTTLERNGVAVGSQQGIKVVSSDPGITALRLGGPGSGGSPRFQGDIAEFRVYHRQLSEAERRTVDRELYEVWFQSARPAAPVREQAVAQLYAELASPRGPFWVSADQRSNLLPTEIRTRLAALSQELELLRKKPAREIPQAVVVQDGGPPGTRHEGFKDAQVYVRGNPKRPGPTVARGFPRILTGDHAEQITTGSGRLQLANWLARPDNPLTARVMVNRIWQHHFGEGLVRTANDFGQRGERPTHPELLDYLAARFVESRWSIKALHRHMMLSSTYQQTCRARSSSLTQDPDNRLLGRMNRRPLSAEAIRDSLLAVAGRLEATPGGPPFKDLTLPRRTLYLLSARTGTNTSEFGGLFDRADPGSIVAQRGQSIVAPQALFFLNDPWLSAVARNLAARVAREAPADRAARIRHLYTLALGRRPTHHELELGLGFLAAADDADPWERYCHLLLCSNEFVYVD